MELCIAAKFVCSPLHPTCSVQFDEMNVSSARSAVRTAGRAARRSIHGDERRTAESALIHHLKVLEAVQANCVGVFVAHDGEPDLMRLVEWLWHRGTTVALPVLEDDPDDFSMYFVPWTAGAALQRGRYGIPVPPAGSAVQPATLLVSLTGFDADGNRMGRGGGFFDRYLATYTGDVVGVGFEVQRVPAIPSAPHDYPLPTVVTDLGVRFTQ